MKLYRILAFLACGLTGLQSTQLNAAPKVWVCTIGVDAYTWLKPEAHLKWCTNDVRKFVDRLQGCRLIDRNSDRLIEFIPTGEDELTPMTSLRFEPTEENIRTQLPKFLSRAAEEDTVIIYAAMHGANIKLKADGPEESFLLPVDFNPREISKSTISLRWLREQLAGPDQGGKAITRARTVLLFLDACHSGGIGAVEQRKWDSISTRSIGVVFGQDERPVPLGSRNIYTLVSCDDNEKSAEYIGFQQGIFSFWLGVGLDGAADSNGDTHVAMDELFQFVSTQVSLTAQYLKNREGQPIKQTPQRFLLGNNQDSPKLIKLPVLNSARPALNRVAQLLHALLENYARGISISHGIQKPRVFIAEFSDETVLGGQLGSFGSVARGLLEETLMMPQVNRPPAAYGITSQSSLGPKLRGVRLESLIADTGDSLPKKKPGAEILVHGSFLRISDPVHGDRLQLKLQITNLLDGTSIASVPTTFILNEDIKNLLPISQDKQSALVAQVQPAGKPETKTLPTDTTDSDLKAAPVLDVEQLQQQARQPHPLRHPGGETPRVEVYQGLPNSAKTRVEWLPEMPDNRNVLAFETSAGQELEIHVQNPSTTEWRALIVQIDGLNQIGQSPQLPSEARYWLLPPNSVAKIDQWLDAVPAAAGPDGKTFQVQGNKLLVTAPPDSIAGRQNLLDNLGEIRILMFATDRVLPGSKSVTGDVGIGAGTRVNNEFMLLREWQINRAKNLGTYVIRYQKKAS